MTAAYFLAAAFHDDAGTPAGQSRPDDMAGRSPRALSSEDARLAERVRAGEMAAFEAVFRVHVEVLIRVAQSYLDGPDAARDVVHDVFAGLWSRRAQFRPVSGIRAYLLGAVRNRALNVVRDRGTRDTLMHGAADRGESPGAATAPRRPDELVESAEIVRLVRQAIDALPETQRLPMALRWRDQLEIFEIAATLGVSENAVRIQLSRGLAALRVALPQLFR